MERHPRRRQGARPDEPQSDTYVSGRSDEARRLTKCPAVSNPSPAGSRLLRWGRGTAPLPARHPTTTTARLIKPTATQLRICGTRFRNRSRLTDRSCPLPGRMSVCGLASALIISRILHGECAHSMQPIPQFPTPRHASRSAALVGIRRALACRRRTTMEADDEARPRDGDDER
jgi:hypothetical protein